MTETLNRSTLNQGDKSLLEKLLGKRPSEMGEGEIAIIRARRSYLTPMERETFKEILEVAEEKISYVEMTKAQLLEVCAEKGIDVEPALKKADIVALIEESDANTEE